MTIAVENSCTNNPHSVERRAERNDRQDILRYSFVVGGQVVEGYDEGSARGSGTS